VTTEAERQRWYLASVRSIAGRFDNANTADRIRLLRELKRLAYQEMRRFLITFKEARFIM
jgi:RNase P subunit RPR2